MEYFEAKAGEQGCQALINQALAEYIHNHDLEDRLRYIVREEVVRAMTQQQETITESST